ncbi:hypothetical protein SDC9_110789 [bioreactor metagenome]|uniref:Uncharacterized protein n=1 Tax=bioreactor metagenome TaxID=1076179 RepID=A0A645BEM6_9ZZZZ
MAAVVGIDQRRDFVVEKHFARQRQQTAFDIPRGGGGTAGQNIAEIPLFFDEIFLVGQHHQRILDRSVAVRVVLAHHLPDHEGGLVGPVVVDPVHGPENPALHRLEPVVDVRDRPVLDHITGVFHEVGVDHLPEILIGAAQARRLHLAFGQHLRFRLGGFGSGHIADFKLFAGGCILGRSGRREFFRRFVIHNP